MANGIIMSDLHPLARYNTINDCKGGKLTESVRIQKRLNGFNSSQSEVTKILNYYFSTGVTHKELVSIARVICLKTNIKLDRLAVRDQRVLIKWFEENWSKIYMVLPSIQLLDEKEIPINMTRELHDRYSTKK